MTMDRFTADFDRIFADGQAPKYRQCFCVGPQRGESLCPCALAQKAVEGSKQVRAAASRFTTPDTSEASPTRKTITTEIDHG